ncbi:MAG: DUF3784 domain-containing protein [Lachnospiraceae bacterium]|nr:DUF3784 domain-containing protein [Lachnospiraceae bacterium]
MKLADLLTGPDWIIYVVFLIFTVLSAILISGHGGCLIAGYNTSSKEEKRKYNEKKLCRTVGIGMAVIAILILIMGLLKDILPSFFVYIALGIILIDAIVMIVLENTICRE